MRPPFDLNTETNRTGRDILVVDDNPRIRSRIATILSALDYKVTEAADGGEALDLISRRHFDLLITDLEMAPMDGFALLEGLRQLPATRRAPRVVVCSSHVGDDKVERRPELRAAARLVAKPVQAGELLSAVAAALPRRDLGWL